MLRSKTHVALARRHSRAGGNGKFRRTLPAPKSPGGGTSRPEELTVLDDDIQDIQLRLQRSEYPNEMSISSSVVERLLRSLDWPTHDPKVVYQQYPVARREDSRGWVDFALCHPAERPRVLIEVKRVGRSDGGERQLFEYAFQDGIQLVVLTDGQDWSFFLPAEMKQSKPTLEAREAVPTSSAKHARKRIAFSATRASLAEAKVRRRARRPCAGVAAHQRGLRPLESTARARASSRSRRSPA